MHRGNVRAVAVVHSLPPTHPEWPARLDRAIKALCAGEVDAIIVTGGRDGLYGYNNPRLMRMYLIEHGVPPEKIVWRDIADDKVEAKENPADTGDEVGVAISLIRENGWQTAVIRPVSNWLHLVRIRVIYWWRTRRMGMSLKIRPLSIPIMLGWKWAIMTEIGLCWPLTLIDPGWTGPIARWMRKKRRQGSKLGVAGGDSSGNA